jgi:hypothetical protein
MENTKGRDHLEDEGIDGKNGSYRNRVEKCGLDSSGSG